MGLGGIAGTRQERRERRGDYSSISERSDRGDSSVAAEGDPSPSPLGVQGDDSLASRQACRGMVADRASGQRNTLEAYKVLAL